MAAMRSLMLAAAVIVLTAAKHPVSVPATDPAPATAPTIKAGVEKWRAGDYAGAVAIWQPFAAAGDADALFNMGQAYKLGRGVTADAATARDDYRKAAVKGHLPAQANLGIALFQAGEKPEAIKWLRTAADRGEARAQYVLGIATFNGDGVPRSQSVGYGYLLRAQASGLPQAATALGSIAPGLSPADRSAGEAVAASLAAGTGVPAALAAATAPRLIPAMPPARTAATLPVVTPPHAATLPVVTPPATTAVPGTTGTAAAVPSTPAAVQPPVAPGRPALATRPAAPPATDPVQRPVPVTVGSRAAAAPAADRPVLPPAPRPAPPTPIREPTPAQADAAAALPSRPAVATVDVPASRPAAEPPRADAPPARAAARGSDPLAPPVKAVAAAGAQPSAAALRPFQTADVPVKKPDGWRVQLGAFSSRKLADAAWADAKTAAGPAKPLFATDGAVTKLQMGPFPTRDAAKTACARLTAAGRACFVTQG